MSRTLSLFRLTTPRIQVPRQHLLPVTLLHRSQPLSQSTTLLARKDAQDKDSLKPEPNEYSKSGSDDEAARVSDTAFSPDKTTPEEQHSAAGAEGGEGNPLDVSPANHEVSQPRGQTEGGHEGSSSQSGQGPSDRARTSGKGSPNKAGGK